MSHFTVMVRLPAALHINGLNEPLEKALIPFQENACTGECPEQFMRFTEDEEGDLDGKTGKRGRWDNPYAKWDWWCIGGRWRGRIPVRAGVDTLLTGPHWSEEYSKEPIKIDGVDACRICDIDSEIVEKQRAEGLDKEWEAWSRFARAGYQIGNSSPFDGPRHTALDYGFCSCFGEDETDKIAKRVAAGGIVVPWNNERRRVDVYDKIDEAEFCRRLEFAYSPLSTYAYLDGTLDWSHWPNNWHEPGEMGWFGVSHAEGQSRVDFKAAQQRWIREGDQRDIIVIVDCHI